MPAEQLTMLKEVYGIYVVVLGVVLIDWPFSGDTVLLENVDVDELIARSHTRTPLEGSDSTTVWNVALSSTVLGTVVWEPSAGSKLCSRRRVGGRALSLTVL